MKRFVSKVFCICILIAFASINSHAVNSEINNEVVPSIKDEKVSNQLKKENTKHTNLKGKKLQKRIRAFIEKMRKQTSDEEKDTPVVAELAFVLGLASIPAMILVGPLLGLGALILGVIALNKIKKSNGKLKGRKKAWVGISFGIIVILLTLWVFYYLIFIREG